MINYKTKIISGREPRHIAEVDRLFREYAAWLGHDFCFQGFDEELATLPGKYAPPDGRILLALVSQTPGDAKSADMATLPPTPRHTYPLAAVQGFVEPHRPRGHEQETIAGCVALRKMSDDVCEMKRMYLRPEFRGRGIGRALATAIIEEAKTIGYRSMRLDTLESLTEAITLYSSLGFEEIPAYYFNPISGVKYFELNLAQPSPITKGRPQGGS